MWKSHHESRSFSGFPGFCAIFLRYPRVIQRDIPWKCRDAHGTKQHQGPVPLPTLLATCDQGIVAYATRWFLLAILVGKNIRGILVIRNGLIICIYIYPHVNKGCSMGSNFDQKGMEKAFDQQERVIWKWTYHEDGWCWILSFKTWYVNHQTGWFKLKTCFFANQKKFTFHIDCFPKEPVQSSKIYGSRFRFSPYVMVKTRQNGAPGHLSQGWECLNEYVRVYIYIYTVYIYT